MIPDRLPWRHRARPSATLHEIQVHPEEWTCSLDGTKHQSRRQAETLSSRFGVRLCVPGLAEFDRIDLSIFFLCPPKIHILRNLPRGIGHVWRKILSCKDLSLKYSRVTTYLRSEGRSGERWWRTGSGSNRACNELALSEILSKGCASQEVSFSLWKAVEKE
jgi:hypothetical protein